MTNHTIKLGGGLWQDGDVISVYVLHAEDSVLGIVVDSRSDNFLVDIKGQALAFLPVLACEGGTRRNIPKFEVTTIIEFCYCHRLANTLFGVCLASGKAAEFGALKDGYMFECTTGLSRIYACGICCLLLLSSPTCPVLDALGKKLSFEIAVGLNGRVWVNAASPPTTIIVANAIMNSETLSGAQQRIMVENLLQKIQ
uniref:Exosome complex exonuclease rrp40 n=1 Tax=Cajanus cajan TaxID=3821 RepID=A0A151TA71_CAJCA|nr:Putative exosome complex exonuclease rrp40 [Cajanus cajan]